jgi:hypothetical protein
MQHLRRSCCQIGSHGSLPLQVCPSVGRFIKALNPHGITRKIVQLILTSARIKQIRGKECVVFNTLECDVELAQ